MANGRRVLAGLHARGEHGERTQTRRGCARDAGARDAAAEHQEDAPRHGTAPAAAEDARNGASRSNPRARFASGEACTGSCLADDDSKEGRRTGAVDGNGDGPPASAGTRAKAFETRAD